MNPLYTFLPPKAIPFWENFPKNRRFPPGDGADAGGVRSDGGADAGEDAQRWRRGRGGDAHSGGGADAPERCLPRPAMPVIRTRPAVPVIRTRPVVPVIRRGPPCPSSAEPAMPVIRTRPAMPVIRRGPPCPSSAAARHARHPHAARHARHPHAARHARHPHAARRARHPHAARHACHPPRPAVPVIRRGPSSAARAAQTKKAPRGARDVFSDAARARAHTRRAGREKFFRCCAGAYAPPAGASGSVTSPIFSMRSSLTAVRPLRSA